MTSPSKEQAEEAVRTLLAWMEQDLSDPRLADTPHRLTSSLKSFFAAKPISTHELLKQGLQSSKAPGLLIMIPRVPFFSFCEHHIAPISGSITIGYAPGEHIIGLGRLTTALEHFSHRLILQEPFTTELAELLTEVLQPQGLAVVVDAVHSCIQMRGERRQGGPLRTAHFSGSFSNQLSLREEFWHLMAV